ncbi:arylamine N-acetyltransferase [Pantoea agglomerans]|jgi:N-hydroxyarylamine O-acetyltransferase|uniref:N-acetyl transferase n=2 Tax=Pantoea TaxID=53335 RepID=A0A650FPS1_ENTAG|nr:MULTISPECIES: arylamine N-acetyltransferase [Pantoea]ERM09982.1 arylamine N-acetyltransferase [Pantoea agglomerans Tx10]KJH60898.1 arylamine N-acetyltransferase [Pantoea agglomerans]KYN63159.1 arylamine N-acetyltransferase [Pantoea agglomerans]MCX2905178.1 arylamine N-acetyltransferase [[Curtobacterium] plantarum]QGV13011.1 N-acetyl transferase [Pantoea agglomerans Tx10]
MDMLAYLKRLKINEKIEKDGFNLSTLHNAHFFTVPFENFAMHNGSDVSLRPEDVANKIILNSRGGICFEFSVLLQQVFSHFAVDFQSRMARVLIPHLSPATHQLFLVNKDNERWIFDVGFGAKGPRGLLLLKNGFTHEDDFLSSRVRCDHELGWIVSVKEKSRNDAVWEDIYSFQDVEIYPPDIKMAHFYTLFSPESLLKNYRVASLPTDNGRISIRNNTFTEVCGLTSTSYEIADKEELLLLLSSRFGINISADNVTYTRN